MSNLKIEPLGMIRAAINVDINTMASFFNVTPEFIKDVEDGKEKMNTKALSLGLAKINLTITDYYDLKDFQKYVINLNISDDKKYRIMLLKASELVYPTHKKIIEKAIRECRTDLRK